MAEQEPKHYRIKANFPFGDIVVLQKMIAGLRFENRFALDGNGEKLVGGLLKLATTHKGITLSADRELFRARINEANNSALFPLENMGSPPQHLAGHGRLNPRGIPYLYLASHPLTAVSECRPHAGAELTVASFKPKKPLRIVNFSSKHMLNPIRELELQAAEITWTQLIGALFSIPFDPRDDTLYVPTQYIAERIKGAGWDGVLYDSALDAGGYNLALFDQAAVAAQEIFSASVERVTVEARFGERKR